MGSDGLYCSGSTEGEPVSSVLNTMIFEVSEKDSRGISSGQLTCAVDHTRDVGVDLGAWSVPSSNKSQGIR